MLFPPLTSAARCYLSFALAPSLWCILLIVLVIQIIQEVVRLKDPLEKEQRIRVAGCTKRDNPAKEQDCDAGYRD